MILVFHKIKVNVSSILFKLLDFFQRWVAAATLFFAVNLKRQFGRIEKKACLNLKLMIPSS